MCIDIHMEDMFDFSIDRKKSQIWKFSQLLMLNEKMKKKDHL